MTAEKIKSYQKLKREKELLEMLITDVGSIGGSKLDGMPRSGKMCSPTETTVLRCEKYVERLKKVEDEMHAIEDAVDSLEDPCERKIVYLIVIRGKRWRDTEKLVKYSHSQTYKIFQKALRRLVSSAKDETK